MCKFISWTTYHKKNYYLTDDCLKTEQGEKLKRHLGGDFDFMITSHDAIDFYYQLNGKGITNEMSDFSDSMDVPSEIKEDFITGKMTIIAKPIPIQCLNHEGHKLFRKLEKEIVLEKENERKKLEKEQFEYAIKVNEEHNLFKEALLETNISIEEYKKTVEERLNKIIEEGMNKFDPLLKKIDDYYFQKKFEVFWDVFLKEENRIEQWK